MYDRQTIREQSQRIIRMSLPVFVEQFFIVLMGVVSTMLVGNLGPAVVSAVGNIDVINNIMISIFSSLAIGGTILVAQFTGRQELVSARRASSQALMASAVLSLVMTLVIFAFQRPLVETLYSGAAAEVQSSSLIYLRIVLWSYPPLALTTTAFGVMRGNGNMRAPMLISIIMNLGNIVLSSVLIYGLSINLGFVRLAWAGLGVAGAGYGLTAARLLGFVLAIRMLAKSEIAFSLRPRDFWRIERSLLNGILLLGIPAGFEQLMFNGGKLIVQLFIVQIGTVALAANAISNSLAAMATMPAVAMSLALTTLVGQSIGRNDREGARRTLSFAVPFSSVILLGMTLIILPLLQPIVGLFTTDPSTRAETVRIMVFYLIVQPLFWPTSFALASGFRGAGDVRYQLVVTMGSMWILRVGLGFLLTRVFEIGVIGIWIAMSCDWVMRSLLFVHRLRSGRWLDRRLLP